jgi:hypothetical protein
MNLRLVGWQLAPSAPAVNACSTVSLPVASTLNTVPHPVPRVACKVTALARGAV